MKKVLSIVISIVIGTTAFTQNLDYEVGVEIQAAKASTQGGTFGGAVKFSLVESETWAFGPSIRYQYLWSKNTYTGNIGPSAKSFTLGGGGFLHYRFFDWFFLGTEIEMLRNPFNYIVPEKKWTLTAFLGGGISHEFNFVRINLGLLYDVVDGLSSPNFSNPSPLSSSYFLQVTAANKNPNSGNNVNNQNSTVVKGKYIPIIYRLAFFFPLAKEKGSKKGGKLDFKSNSDKEEYERLKRIEEFENDY